MPETRIPRRTAIAVAVAVLVGAAACQGGTTSPGPGGGSAAASAAASAPASAPDRSSPAASSGVTITANPNPADDDGRFFRIEDVGFESSGSVRLRNFSPVEASLEGLYLCTPPKCASLPASTVPAETTVHVALGAGDGLESPVATDLGLTLVPASGEIGLYGSDKVDDPNEVRAYLEWGSTPHVGTPTAIEAGLWIEGSYVPSSPTAKRIYRGEDGGWKFE